MIRYVKMICTWRLAGKLPV